MTKFTVDELIADLELTRKGKEATAKLAAKIANAPSTEGLSNPIDLRVLPINYRNLYERLKINNPAKAKRLWNKWAIDPRPKANPLAKHEPALKALSRLNTDNTLKRRI